MKSEHWQEIKASLLANPAFSLTPKSEIMAELERARKEPAVNIFRTEAFTIEHWADYSFTADGRIFGLFIDGESIAHRLAAREVTGIDLAERRNEFKEIAGFILESDQPPIIFKDYNELLKAWSDLHQMFNAAFSDQEYEELGIEDDEL